LDDGEKKVVVSGKSDNRPTVSFLYLIGLDDVGHRDLSRVLLTIAGSCDYRVDFKPQALLDITRISDPIAQDMELSLYLRKVAEASTAEKTKTIIIDQLILPQSVVLSNSTVESAYTLRQMFKRGLMEGVVIKVLYLKGDFYDTVARQSARSGGTFEDSAKIVQSLIQYLTSEHASIASNRVDPWAAVRYEWFANMKDCRVLVSAIIDFAGWDRCDVEYACQALKRIAFRETKPAVDEKNFQYAQTLDVETDIPVLEISPHRVFQITFWKASATSRQRGTPAVVRPAGGSVEPSSDRRAKRGISLEARLRGPRQRRDP
jgi:hypothetical protein